MVNLVYLTLAVCTAVSDGLRPMSEVSSHHISCHSTNETVTDIGIDEEFAGLPTMRCHESVENCSLHAVDSPYVKSADIESHKHFGRQWLPHILGTQWAHKPI